MFNWDIIFPMLKRGESDEEIAKAMKPFWRSTKADREQRAAHTRQAFYGTIHNYPNSWGKTTKPQT